MNQPIFKKLSKGTNYKNMNTIKPQLIVKIWSSVSSTAERCLLFVLNLITNGISP
jgi:hypothetical protein